MNAISGCLRSAGRTFSEAELRVVTEVVANGDGRSRAQLMVQVCQRLQWRRPSGALKVRECRDLLLTMERDDRLQLPPKRAAGRPRGARTRVPCTRAGEPGPPLLGTVGQFGAVRLQPVATRADHGWWRELIGRYHYLGYRVPFGAQLRYLAFVSQPTPAVVAALQVSSPAWRLATRDRWIGWDDAAPAAGGQQQPLPGTAVGTGEQLGQPVAGAAGQAVGCRLARALRHRATRPLLIETLVDRRRFAGTCYRAANWIELGDTSGRGRMDRAHARHGQAPKRVLVYPGGQRSAPARRGVVSGGRCARLRDRDR